MPQEQVSPEPIGPLIVYCSLLLNLLRLGRKPLANDLVLLPLPVEEAERWLGGVVYSAKAVVCILRLLSLLLVGLGWISVDASAYISSLIPFRSVCALDYFNELQIY